MSVNEIGQRASTKTEWRQRTFIVREVVLHRADRQFLLESVNLVQEQDDGCVDEPSRVADRVEQGKSLLHSVDGFIFEEELVVL